MTTMSAVTVNKKLTKIQNKLFEKAHTEPLELKFLAISLNKQGIKGDKLYSHPELIPLPMRNCAYLSTLSPRQVAIISAAYFANFYKAVANSESQTLVSNMGVADKVFTPYSDEYMVMHQETTEEFDHIWTFRTVHSMVCRETGVDHPFNEAGFFCGKVGAMPKQDFEGYDTRFTYDTEVEETLTAMLKNPNFLADLTKEWQQRDRSWRYRTLKFLIGDAMRLLPAETVQDYGLGGLWLLYRYVSNVELKQAEAYLFDAPDQHDYEPLAYQINQGHLHDEARHYTSSFDLGLEIYKAAIPEAQAFIRMALVQVMEDYIDASMLTYIEMLDATDEGMVFTNVDLGLKSLTMALNHPDFADRPADVDALKRAWQQMKWRKIVSAHTQKRWRYIAQQLDRLVQALDVELDAAKLGNLYDRYQNALTAPVIDGFIEVA